MEDKFTVSSRNMDAEVEDTATIQTSTRWWSIWKES